MCGNEDLAKNILSVDLIYVLINTNPFNTAKCCACLGAGIEIPNSYDMDFVLCSMS